MNTQYEQSVLIIGAGPGGNALLDIFSKEAQIKVVGIVDSNPDAVGIRLAHQLGIEVFADLEAALRKCSSSIVFNMTHDQDLTDIAVRHVGPGSVIGGQEAKFFWHIIARLQALKNELLENQMRMRAVIHNVQEGIISINPGGTIEDANPAVEKIFGFAQSELIGKPIGVLMPAPDRQQHNGYIQKYLHTGERQVIGKPREVLALHKNGHTFPLEINIAEMELDGRLHFVGLIRDITERKIAEEKLTQMALYDHLTGLPNRTNFFESLEFSLSQARRIASMVALLFIDLDGFKQVNDSMGHAMGDHLLKEVARRLLGNIRASDFAARMGGDEFTVILNNLKGVNEAVYVAEKLIEALNQPIELNGDTCRIGASIGISIFPDHTDSIDILIKAADSAMYRAKANGKNNYQIGPGNWAALEVH